MDADWSAALQRIVMSPLPGSESNPRSSKYPSGDIWKCVLGASISADLDSGTEDDQRFIRIDNLGLSGVIFYRVPRRACIPSDQTKDTFDVLIERSTPRVLYFPHFACTSFVTGQVIKSHLLLDPTISPKPHPSGFGFSLDSRAFETLGRSLAGDAFIPIRDLSVHLKPTHKCADRVLKDRQRAKHAARLLLAIRCRNAIHKTPQTSTISPPALLEEPRFCKPDYSCPEDVEEEEYHDALETLPHSPLLLATMPNPSLDGDQLPSVPALRDHGLANKRPAATVLDHKDLGRKLLEVELGREKGLMKEKENSFAG